MKSDQFHLSDLPETHLRNVWQPDTDDLHMNLLVLRAEEQIDSHINQILDVIVTCLDGSGTITIDETHHDVAPGSIVLIRRGVNRVIRAGENGMVYTTVHRKRGGIVPTLSKPTS